MFVNSGSVVTMMNTKLIEQIINNLLKKNDSLKYQFDTRNHRITSCIKSKKKNN